MVVETEARTRNRVFLLILVLLYGNVGMVLPILIFMTGVVHNPPYVSFTLRVYDNAPSILQF